ncbi:MAG: hypothetical protein JWN45_2293 [Acidobacteriaceae bacterium]|nr:hypothetical protein [Acidobacteriaceae bacterium]
MRWNPKSSLMLAVFASVALTTLAFLFIFVGKPGGFESQIGYFFAALPGSIPAMWISDWVYRKGLNIFWALEVSFNLAWYFLLSSGVIQLWKLQTRLRAEG